MGSEIVGIGWCIFLALEANHCLGVHCADDDVFSVFMGANHNSSKRAQRCHCVLDCSCWHAARIAHLHCFTVGNSWSCSWVSLFHDIDGGLEPHTKVHSAVKCLDGEAVGRLSGARILDIWHVTGAIIFFVKFILAG
eukprot:TRINITY_DN40322_c0_g1_i1.p2 TRINITY_DN40322_c0_g1~~TRINITY_DN40322_c0_g1_i1.p2  ORF type:complete len:145 (-),score=7.04 TRINITY_DN40322_c0_g1_i1:64-474(-)